MFTPELFWGFTLPLLLPSILLLYISLRSYLSDRRAFKIRDVLSNVGIFVGAVEQTYKTRPAGTSPEEWNAERKQAAMRGAELYAASLNVKLTTTEYILIDFAVEAFVTFLKKSVIKDINITSVGGQPPAFPHSSTTNPLMPQTAPPPVNLPYRP